MSRRRTRPAAVAALIAVLAVAGCGPAAPSPSASPSASPSPVASPSASASPGASALGPPSSALAGGRRVDRTLLDILPADIDGVPLQPDDETAAAIDGLPEEVEAIAIGLYIQPGSSTADDLAIANIVRLRAGVFDETWFRSWRETYDEGACKVAGGIAPGTAETRIGEHDTHIGSCKGAVHTYHVHLVSPDRVLSITAAGERRFGERVIAGLTE